MARYVVPVRAAVPADQVVSHVIAGLDDGQLASLLASRPDLMDRPLHSLAELQQRAGSRTSVQLCVESLDLAGQQVIQALSLLPARTTVENLAELLGAGVTRSELDPVLDRLTGLALLACDGSLRIAESARQTVYPAGLGPRLAELTDRLRVEELQAVAELIGAERPKRKAELEAAVHLELTRPGRVAQLLQDAPEPVLELALALAFGPPAVEMPYTYYGHLGEQTPEQWLKSRGLIVAPSYGIGLMPREVAIAIRGGRIFPDLQLTRPPLEMPATDTGAAESSAVEHARQLVEALTRLLEELEQRPGVVLKNGGVGIREVRRVATLLGVGDEAAARLIELGAAAALLGPADGRLLVTPGFDLWRERDTTSRWAALADAWLGLPRHLSVAGSPDSKGKPTPPMLNLPSSHAKRVRRLLLGFLAEAPEGTAVCVESLSAALAWAAPTAWQYGGPPAADLVGEMEMFGLCVDGALSKVGWALTEGGVPAASDTLAELLPKLSSTFVLQADLTAIATGELTADVRRELELMADRESSGAASVYRFSPTSLRRAFDIGRESPSLLAFLAEHAVKGVPQPLEYLIGDLGRRFGQLRLRAAGCYIRSDDAGLLAELPRVRALAPLSLSLIAPTVLTSMADEETVMAELRAAGYLPAAEGPDGQPRLLRPVPQRALVTAPVSGAGEPDFTELVAQLHKGSPEPVEGQLSLTDDGVLLESDRDSEPVRPCFLSKDAGTMRILLALAIEQEWAVAVTLAGLEVVVLPWDLEGGDLYGEGAHSGEELRLATAKIEAVRILDPEEEFDSVFSL